MLGGHLSTLRRDGDKWCTAARNCKTRPAIPTLLVEDRDAPPAGASLPVSWFAKRPAGELFLYYKCDAVQILPAPQLIGQEFLHETCLNMAVEAPMAARSGGVRSGLVAAGWPPPPRPRMPQRPSGRCPSAWNVGSPIRKDHTLTLARRRGVIEAVLLHATRGPHSSLADFAGVPAARLAGIPWSTALNQAARSTRPRSAASWGGLPPGWQW